MRNWVNELTGRSDSAPRSLRVPSSDEISQLSSMFPDLRREDIVGALQRRYDFFDRAHVSRILSNIFQSKHRDGRRHASECSNVIMYIGVNLHSVM